jgi:hypothetical protein
MGMVGEGFFSDMVTLLGIGFIGREPGHLV